MDSLIAAAGRALIAGDALGALGRVALREDPPALALRGIAMAQLGELALARALLRRAIRGFGAHEPLSRARCVVAEAEVALAMRELSATPRALAGAADTLEARADHANALHARLIAVRRLLLVGNLKQAASALARLDTLRQPPSLAAMAELARAEVAQRLLHTRAARAALDHAREHAQRAGIPTLAAEVAEARTALERPAARRVHPGPTQALRLDQVEALFASGTLVVDACRRGMRAGSTWIGLARRPILFSLLHALAQGWPGDLDRDALIGQAFGSRDPDETHRARLRVGIGRLRALLKPLVDIEATAQGFALVPRDARGLVVLAPPIDGGQASLLALLADGAAWSTSALSLALGASQRTVQRALVELEAGGQVRSIGRARAQRWLAPPLAGFTTVLLLPAALPDG